MPKIYLQRHTQPKIEAQICYGVSDIPLHEDYTNIHLPIVLDRLQGLDIKRLYSSPLKRCFILACDIKKEVGLSNIMVDKRLLELNFGDWEMVSWNDIYMTSEGKAWFDDFLHTPTLNGESFENMVKRADDFLQSIKDQGEGTMVVTHSGFIRAAMVVAGIITIDEAFGVEINYGDLIEINL